MSAFDLTKIDMNLLVVLDILLEERSVSRAASRLYVTQPAISQSLRRLRRLFDDPLLVRVKGRMEPTPKALHLQSSLRAALLRLRSAVEGEPAFEPSTSTMRFRIATLDYVMTALIPMFVGLLQREAPGIDLTISALSSHRVFSALESGEVDLALGVFPVFPSHISSEVLYHEHFLGLVREGHPLAQDPPCIEEYVSYPHILVSTTGEGESIVERTLRGQGLKRRIAVRVPYFLAIPPLLQETQLVATLPAQLVMRMQQSYPLFVFAPPLEIPTFPVEMAWSVRLDAVDAHLWLREKIKQLIKDVLLLGRAGSPR